MSTRAVDQLTSTNPSRYGRGDVVTWTWDPAGLPAGGVDLSVVCDGRGEYVRYTNTANDGVASASLPQAFGAFATCRVEVTSSADASVFGRSGPFEVLDGPVPFISVLAPSANEAIATGQSYVVEWASGEVPAGQLVSVVLRDLTGGAPNRFLGRAAVEAGGFTWTVPTDLSTSDEYRLAVFVRPGDGSVVRGAVDGVRFTAPNVAPGPASSSSEAAPEALTVAPPRPNPSGGAAGRQATVRVGVPEAGPVEVSVYDVRGRRVAVATSGDRPAGWHDVRLDTGALAPGVYVVRASTAADVVTRPLTVVR